MQHNNDNVYLSSKDDLTVRVGFDDDKVRRALGFILNEHDKIEVKNGITKVAENPFDLCKLIPSTVFIHANFANESHCNNRAMKLLGILNLDIHYRSLPNYGFKKNEQRHCLFKEDNLITTVNTNYLKYLHFVITDHNGSPFPFHSDEQMSSLCLTFSNKYKH